LVIQFSEAAFYDLIFFAGMYFAKFAMDTDEQYRAEAYAFILVSDFQDESLATTNAEDAAI
jgi:hypothetical protein